MLHASCLEAVDYLVTLPFLGGSSCPLRQARYSVNKHTDVARVQTPGVVRSWEHTTILKLPEGCPKTTRMHIVVWWTMMEATYA
jgi:hypothetical protein